MQAKLQVQQQQSPQALEQTQQATRPALERDPPPCPDTVLAKRAQVEAEFSASAKSNGDAAIKEENSAPPVASPYNGTATGMKSLVQSESTAKTSATLEEPDGPTVDDSGLASVAAQQLLRGSFMTCSDIYDLAFIYKLSVPPILCSAQSATWSIIRSYQQGSSHSSIEDVSQLLIMSLPLGGGSFMEHLI